MDQQILPLLLSCPPDPAPAQPLTDKQNDELLRTFSEKVRSLPPKKLQQSIAGGETILDILNPGVNTISYAFVLLANIRRLDSALKGQAGDQLAILTSTWFKILEFLDHSDLIQLRYVGSETREIIASLESFARVLGKPAAAIAPITNFIMRLDPQGSTLSSLHLLLCQISLDTDSYDDALPVLERDILFIPSTGTQLQSMYICSPGLPPRQFITENTGLTKPLTSANIQEYFLAGATILIRLNRWHRAAELLENVMSYPSKSRTVSGPAVTAYKKWLLVQLMMTGKMPEPPKMINGKAYEILQEMGKPYVDVAGIFEMGTGSSLRAEISANMKTWRQDGNEGLMGAILELYRTSRILAMSSIFRTVPLSYIMTATGGGESNDASDEQSTIDMIAAMIEQSQLHGRLITDANGKSFLCFDESEQGDDNLMAPQIATAVEHISKLLVDVQAAERSITLEKEYVGYMQKQKKAAGGQGGYAMEEWATGQDDEDLMAQD